FHRADVSDRQSSARLAQFIPDRGTQRKRRHAGADHPGPRSDLRYRSIFAIRDLCWKHIHVWPRVPIESAVTHIAHYPNDLARWLVVEGWSDAAPDNDLVVQGIALRPELLGQCLIDDDQGWTAIILVAKGAAPQDGNLECLKITGRNHRPSRPSLGSRTVAPPRNF